MLKIATYNIAHAEDQVSYRQGIYRMDTDQLADFILEQDLDICALNEVDWNCKRSGYIHEAYLMAKRLTEKTGVKYYFEYAASLVGILGPHSQYGNAIISRYPMQNVRKIPVDIGVGMAEHHEPRVILAADFEIDGKMLTVITTHFGLLADEKALMLEKLRELIPSNPYPVVLLGDFNVRPNSEYYPELTALLKDTSPDPALPLSFPSHAPSAKIDYIFVSESLRASNAHVEPVQYSDHLPLLADIEW